MWKWILDAHRLLGVSVEIVDDQLISLSAGKPAARSESEADSTPSVVAQALATAAPSMSNASGIRVSCTPIMSGTAAAGVVVITAPTGERLGDRELARTGALLANAIEDQLSRPLHERGDS